MRTCLDVASAHATPSFLSHLNTGSASFLSHLSITNGLTSTSFRSRLNTDSARAKIDSPNIMANREVSKAQENESEVKSTHDDMDWELSDIDEEEGGINDFDKEEDIDDFERGIMLGGTELGLDGDDIDSNFDTQTYRQ